MFTLVDGYSVKETRRMAREEAEKEKAIEIAKKLIKRNRPVEEIIEDTGLSHEEVEQLCSEMAIKAVE